MRTCLYISTVFLILKQSQSSCFIAKVPEPIPSRLSLCFKALCLSFFSSPDLDPFLVVSCVRSFLSAAFHWMWMEHDMERFMITNCRFYRLRNMTQNHLLLCCCNHESLIERHYAATGLGTPKFSRKILLIFPKSYQIGKINCACWVIEKM